jgi:putative transposase
VRDGNIELETPEETAAWREGIRRHEAIRGLLNRHEGPLRLTDVRNVAWDLGVSQATLYRLIGVFKLIGTVESLRPRKGGRPKGLRLLDPKIEAIIAKCIREIYLTPSRVAMKRLTDEIHAKCASAGLELPDWRTIRARVRAIPERTRALRRMDTKGVKATSPTPGKLVATRPLEIVQIDHTKVDVVVVDEDNRKALPGRPYLTLAIDVFSRMVTGFELSMSEPSRLSNGLCMLRATFDKTAWLADHGVIEEWPVVGLPECIGVDNGADFRSAAFQRACENEGIRVEFRPPGKARYGGHIERLMGAMMKDVHVLPGTTFSNIVERGRQAPLKSAGLTLHELETYFAIEIVEGYHQRIHSGLQRPPIAVWREAIADTPLRMPKDRMAFWVSFLPEARRKLRPDGVHMFGGGLKYWNGALASDLGRAGRDVLVKYDPRDISRVFVGRASGHFVEAQWSNLTWPPVSLHEWDNQQRELGRSGRSERDTGAILRGIAGKRSLIERAKRLTYEANKKYLPLPKKLVDDSGLGSLKGVDSSTPVPGEG